MQDEGELIRAAAGGDRRAFDDLVRRKREQVVRIAYQVTGDLDDALDVAQGVFVKLWKRLGRFDLSRRFDTWLYRITMNAAIDWVRMKGSRAHLHAVPGGLDEAPAPAGAEPEAVLDLVALRRAFLRLAAALPPQQRAVFVLRDIEGLETSEVARALEITESTVRNHLQQARRTLRRGLERDYPSLVPRASAGQRRASREREEEG